MNSRTRRKSTIFTAVLLALSPALTACDPPMPPELLAQISEQTVTCESGDAKFKVDANLQDMISGLVESVAQACPDPVMTFTVDDSAADEGIVISSQLSEPCTPKLTVPFAYDAGVAAFYLGDASEVSLSPATLAAVLNGQITNWSDDKIVAENPDQALPDEAIILRSQADEASVGALSQLMKINQQTLSTENFDLFSITDVNMLEPLAEGEVAILPASVATAGGYSSIAIATGKTDADGFGISAVADADGIYSASTQLVATVADPKITATLDATIEPKSIFEGEAAAEPYQAIFPVNLYICGSDSKLNHAAATFVLRLDSQGSLTGFNFGQVPESIRVQAVALARKGLPEPTAQP